MEIENLDKLQSFLTGEALLCGLLGRSLYADPDKAWLEQLIREDVFSEVPLGTGQPDVERGRELLDQWARRNPDGLAQTEFEAIQADQLVLFLGVGKPLAPVWESIYFHEDRLIFQEETLQVRQWFARFGLQFEHLHREPDDHIGIELSFVAHLASLALQALDAGQIEKAAELLHNQGAFLNEHLLRWAPAWADLVEANARTDFYTGLACLTRGALLSIAQELSIPAGM